MVWYRLRGIRGSIVTALGTILPSFLIILAIALFFHNFKDNVYVERIFKLSLIHIYPYQPQRNVRLFERQQARYLGGTRRRKILIALR